MTSKPSKSRKIAAGVVRLLRAVGISETRVRSWVDLRIEALRQFRKRHGTILGFPRHLHLGCGPLRAEGFCNVDITPYESVDVVDDVSKLGRFPDGHAQSIYACLVLEH